jgi:hypothetical protein
MVKLDDECWSSSHQLSKLITWFHIKNLNQLGCHRKSTIEPGWNPKCLLLECSGSIRGSKNRGDAVNHYHTHSGFLTSYPQPIPLQTDNKKKFCWLISLKIEGRRAKSWEGVGFDKILSCSWQVEVNTLKCLCFQNSFLPCRLVYFSSLLRDHWYFKFFELSYMKLCILNQLK